MPLKIIFFNKVRIKLFYTLMSKFINGELIVREVPKQEFIAFTAFSQSLLHIL